MLIESPRLNKRAHRALSVIQPGKVQLADSCAFERKRQNPGRR